VRANVSDALEVLDTIRFLSDFSGRRVRIAVADQGALRNKVQFKGVIHGFDMELARAFLHAQGIAVLEVEEEAEKVIWVLDRSDMRPTENR
jgi:hypothetical protein